ncbi:hypothetical protein [Streptomyces sp. NBC_01235]|uniref:hypothetical protein n=1 Tax=Streptomyces sp. NBC_01235 TaxID=2903788 RepID=UPI002E1245F7|nr:hypothetical protein OG289_34415 [Streptomyces sp. NBC_01235]
MGREAHRPDAVGRVAGGLRGIARSRLVCGAAKAWAAKGVADAVIAEVEKRRAAKRGADAVVAEVEKRWVAHPGVRRMRRPRALTLLREITSAGP